MRVVSTASNADEGGHPDDRHSALARHAAGHDGSILGFNSLIAYRPETRESIVVLANLDLTSD